MIGDAGSGKTRFLLTGGSICYKSIFASGASTTSPLFSILDIFNGTLLIDEGDFPKSDEKADIVKILNNGGDYDRVTAKWVGSMIQRRFHLKTERRQEGYIIPKRKWEKVENLLERYGIKVQDSAKPERGRILQGDQWPSRISPR